MSFGDAVAGSCGRDIVREVGSVYCRWHEDFSFVFHCPTLTGRTTTINKSHLLLLAIFATLRFYESEISQWVRYIIWVFLLVDKFCIYELIVGLRTRERKSGNSLWILLSGWSGQGTAHNFIKCLFGIFRVSRYCIKPWSYDGVGSTLDCCRRNLPPDTVRKNRTTLGSASSDQIKNKWNVCIDSPSCTPPMRFFPDCRE